jgi:hypothetical protein
MTPNAPNVPSVTFIQAQQHLHHAQPVLRVVSNASPPAIAQTVFQLSGKTVWFVNHAKVIALNAAVMCCAIHVWWVISWM